MTPQYGRLNVAAGVLLGILLGFFIGHTLRATWLDCLAVVCFTALSLWSGGHDEGA